MTHFSRSVPTVLVLAGLTLTAGCSHQAAPPAANIPALTPVTPNQTPQMQQAMATHASGEMNLARKRGEMMKRMRENQKGPQ